MQNKEPTTTPLELYRPITKAHKVKQMELYGWFQVKKKREIKKAPDCTILSPCAENIRMTFVLVLILVVGEWRS